MEIKKMDKQVVKNAMNPLDAAFAGITNLRKGDKGDVAEVVKKVKAAVQAEVLKDLTQTLSGNEVKKVKAPAKAKVTPAKKGKVTPSKKKAHVAKTPTKKAAVVQAAPAVADASLRGTSTVVKPTKLVWEIAEKMVKADKAVKRADIMAECAKRGITFYTARTQYQLWKSSKG